MKNIKALLPVVCLIIWFPSILLAQTQTVYNPGKDPKYNLGKGSNVNADLNFRMGTGGVHLYVGTQTCDGVGTNGVVVGSSSAAPQIEITYGAGSTSCNFKNMNVKVDGSAVASTGNTIAATSGAGSDTTLTNPSFVGTGDMASDFSIDANGANISDDEIAFLNGLYSNIQNQLDAKVGSSTPRIAVVECGGTTTVTVSGSATVKFQGGGDLTSIMTDDGGGHFTITTSLTGTPTAKPDVYEGTQSVVTGANKYSFGSETFSITPDGVGGVNIDLGAEMKATGNDQYTKLLLHGDQVGSLSTYLDSSEQEETVTASGSVNGTTTQSVFGGSSFAFDGTSDMLTVADNSRLELGSNDFMLETRVRFSAFDRGYIALKEQSPSTDFIFFGYNHTNSDIRFQQKSGGSWVVDAGSGSWTASLNTWYHIACIRKGSKFRFYVDGSQIGADALDTSAIVDNNAAWTIGGVASDPVTLNGYMDEIRFTIGTGRKPASAFSIPTAAYGSFTPQLSY